jgi:hypothetical protein
VRKAHSFPSRPSEKAKAEFGLGCLLRDCFRGASSRPLRIEGLVPESPVTTLALGRNILATFSKTARMNRENRRNTSTVLLVDLGSYKMQNYF